MNCKYSVTIFATLCFLVIPITSQSQSETADPEKLAADQADCQQHAMEFSGYNPAAPEQPAASNSPRQSRAGLRGAARGAAAGAVAGGTLERYGDEDKHDDATEVGAAVGAVAGGARARRNAKQQEPPPAPAPAGDPALYSSSYNDCMASRGHQIQ